MIDKITNFTSKLVDKQTQAADTLYYQNGLKLSLV